MINYGIPASQIGYVKAGYPKPEGNELVIVALIQTLARRDYPESMGLVIFDECHTTVNIFTRICPECGYEFPPSEQPELEDNYLAKFGELLDEETKKKVTYIRGQRKSRFTKKLTPETLWELWYRRYPDDILCNDWLYQAVNRGDNSVAAQQQFLTFIILLTEE